MIRATTTALAFALAGCTAIIPTPPDVPVAPISAQRPPVAADAMPVRGDPPPLPAADAVLTRIAVGCCSDQTGALPVFAAVAAARPQLFLYVGDNVHGDAPDDPQLVALRQAYDDLAMNAWFASFNMAVPMLATWDRRDYGADDGSFPYKDLSEQLFERFWREAAAGADHPGVYGARSFGPPGRRVQLILLDTRFFRSPENLLGEAQWAWLERTLREPADLRLLVSPARVLAEAGGDERWGAFPAEQARLLRTLRDSGAKGVVLVSGGPAGALHRREDGAYPLVELGVGSLNLGRPDAAPERAAGQLGPSYPPANFGLVEIDWAGRTVALSIRDLDGANQRGFVIPFRDLGHS